MQPATITKSKPISSLTSMHSAHHRHRMSQARLTLIMFKVHFRRNWSSNLGIKFLWSLVFNFGRILKLLWNLSKRPSQAPKSHFSPPSCPHPPLWHLLGRHAQGSHLRRQHRGGRLFSSVLPEEDDLHLVGVELRRHGDGTATRCFLGRGDEPMEPWRHHGGGKVTRMGAGIVLPGHKMGI